LNCLGDPTHDTGAAAEVQNLANLEVGAPGVDGWIGSDESLDGDAVGLSDGGAELARGDFVCAAATGCRCRLGWSRRRRATCARSTSASRAVADRGSGRRRGRTDGGVALDVAARVGEIDGVSLLRRALVADVGDKHVWAVVECRGAAALDGNVRAVHVHLPVAGLVKPCPRPDRIASLGFGGDGKAVGLVRVEDVSTSRADAVADERLDNFPSLTLVERERDLARTTAVRSCQALRLEGCRLTCGIGL